jgi:enoyl-CoA hydratase/carnithine racemase
VTGAGTAAEAPALPGRPAVHTEVRDGVGIATFGEPPNNYLNIWLLTAINDALLGLDADERCRALILRSEGKHFCAGRDFSAPRRPEDASELLYAEAARLFRISKPWVALVQGGAIGSGCGLAAAADFRIAAPAAYFYPNFVKVGLHHGFGLSLTLPAIIGPHQARRALYFGERLPAEEARRIGLADAVAADAQDLVPAGLAFAGRLAGVPPAALASIRLTCRKELTEAGYLAAVAHESAEQARLLRAAAEAGR